MTRSKTQRPTKEAVIEIQNHIDSRFFKYSANFIPGLRIIRMHIAVAGNIGSGKTTLTGLLAKHFAWEPQFEEVDDNPYLNDFYDDMQRWSFNLQVYFLNKRFNQIIDIRESGRSVIQDRTIYEDAEIFAPNLHAMGLMTTRDFNNYQDLFRPIQQFLNPPDLLILPACFGTHLGAQHPKTRPRLRKFHPHRLPQTPERPLRKLDHGLQHRQTPYRGRGQHQFPENPEDLGTIVNSIQAEIHGLF